MNLTRPEFLDRRLEPEELQTATLLWLHWFNMAHQAVMSGMTQTPTPGSLRVEVRLWGFPRHQNEAVKKALDDALSSADGATASVALQDPDTVTAQSPYYSATTDLKELPSFLPWFTRLLDDEFSGLWCQIRLTAADQQKRAAVQGNTLVFAGVLHGAKDGFRTRAIYPIGPNGENEWMSEHHGWDRQGEYLRLLDDTSFLPDTAQDSTVPELPLTVFTPPLGSSLGRSLLWLIAPQKSRFTDYALRISLLLGVCLGSIFLAAAVHDSYPLLFWFALTPLAFLSGMGTLFLLWFVINRVRTVYALMSHSMERLYGAPIAHPERILEHNPGFANDPALKKYSAELAHLGWDHYQDIGIEPSAAGASYIRLYMMPEESALFALMLMRGAPEMSHYPARHGMIIKTFFTDGSYLVSTNGHTGYRRSFHDLPGIQRVFSEVTNPEEMWQRHQKSVAHLLKQGKQKATLTTDEIIPHLLDEHERNRAALMKYGAFDWEAAFRMAFDLVRPEYRG